MGSKISGAVGTADKVARISTNPTHPYTFTFTTASCATPTYLRQVQQSDLDPVFIGKYAQFFRSNVPLDFGFEHIFLVPGNGHGSEIELMKWPLRQQWSFIVESDFAYKNTDNDALVGQQQQLSSPEANKTADLKDALSRVIWDNRTGSRYYILRFLNFKASNSEEKYQDHIAELLAARSDAQSSGGPDIQIHLSGRIARMGALKDRIFKVHHEEKAKDWFTLMSCGTEAEYDDYLASQVFEGLKKNGVEESMVLTKQMWLPPKDEKINISDWKYGNPHEPYGQDWFG